MWCYALGVVAVVLRSWCVVMCTVCQLVSNYGATVGYMKNAWYTVPSFAEMFVYMHTACLVKYRTFYTHLLCPLIGFKTVARVV